MSRKLTPYQRIMKAAERGVGVRFSAEETFRLSLDDAIHTRALLDDDEDAGIPESESMANKGWDRV